MNSFVFFKSSKIILNQLKFSDFFKIEFQISLTNLATDKKKLKKLTK